MKHQEKNKLLEKNRILLRYAYGLVLLAITAVYFLDDRAESPVKKISYKNSFPTSTPLQKTEVIIEESVNENNIYESQEYTVLLDEISDSVNNLSEKIASKKLEFDELKPFIVSKEINLEMLEIDEDVPKVIFDVRSTTWLWIKFADESIDEFVVKKMKKF